MRSRPARCRLGQVSRRALRRWFWRRLRGGRLTPARAGRSVAAGLFVGSLPLFGFHLPLCLAIALPLRLDALVVYGAANISNPFVAPFLIMAEYEVGAWLLSRAAWGFDVTAFRLLGLSGFIPATAVGAAVVGGTLALVGGFAAARLVTRLTPLHDRAWSARRRTTRRYRALPRRERCYVALKLRSDPLYRDLSASHHVFGHLLDAGCGRAQLSLYLKDVGNAAEIQGFDADPAKVATARAASGGACRFWTQSLAADEAWPRVDTVLLVDVLHYLPRAEHRRILTRARAALRPGGRIVIREIDAGRRSSLGRLAERIGVNIGMNRGTTLHFLEEAELRDWLEALGFVVTTLAHAGRSRLANFVLLATLTESRSARNRGS